MTTANLLPPGYTIRGDNGQWTVYNSVESIVTYARNYPLAVERAWLKWTECTLVTQEEWLHLQECKRRCANLDEMGADSCEWGHDEEIPRAFAELRLRAEKAEDALRAKQEDEHASVVSQALWDKAHELQNQLTACEKEREGLAADVGGLTMSFSEAIDHLVEEKKAQNKLQTFLDNISAEVSMWESVAKISGLIPGIRDQLVACADSIRKILEDRD